MAIADWYESEPPLHRVLAAELQRLKRRAQARWPLVVVVAVALTAAVVWKVARKPGQYRARVVLALTEGELAGRGDVTPLHELRDYVGTVLLSNAALLELVERRGLFARARAQFGDDYAVQLLRDQLGIGVWRNYFQYSYSYDERRTARIAIAYVAQDPDHAYEMARDLTSIVIAREGERRIEAARLLAEQARGILDAARAELAGVRAELNAEVAALAEAERRGEATEVAVHRLRAAELTLAVTRAQEAFFALEQTTTGGALQAAATAAGLALELTVVDERRPPRAERPVFVLVAVGVFALGLFLPLAGIVIGAFDTRVHDLEDVSRLELTALGHLPPFPGDDVGALRGRGVPRRAVPSWWPWRWSR